MSSSSSSTALRQPSEAHKNRNGFRDSYEPSNKESPDDIALRNHRYAQWVLRYKGTPLPSKESLRDIGGKKKPPQPETIASIDEKLRDLKRQHARDLESLFSFQAGELHQEMLDHRRCFDDSAYMDIDENDPDQVEFRNALKELDIRMRDMPHLKPALEDSLSTLRYTHLKALLPLLDRKRTLKKKENEQRKKRDAMFPHTVEEYRKIADREVQLRIARFLMASGTEQERMMDKFGWAYRAVDPLRAVSCFARQAEFRTEIESTMKDIRVSDPRKRARPPTTDQDLPYATFSPVS
ncbi:hypothetical protein ID866_4986 [Astraeus odoratus]|nr:hypothetical protein ID866_4986 [Astraeus odoratus]